MPDHPDDGTQGINSEELRAAEQTLRAIPEYAWLAESGQQWYTVAEVAEAMSIGKDVIRRWCERGLIANAVMYGQQIGWRLPRSGLLLFFATIVRGGGRLNALNSDGNADGTNGQ